MRKLRIKKLSVKVALIRDASTRAVARMACSAMVKA